MSVNEKMIAIADAIRGKTGGTELLGLDAMAQAIAALETGGKFGDYEVVSGSFVPPSDVSSGTYTIYTGFLDPNSEYIKNSWFMVFLDDEVTSKYSAYEFLLAILLQNVGNSKYASYGYKHLYIASRPSSTDDSIIVSTYSGYFSVYRNTLAGEIRMDISCQSSMRKLLAGKKYTWVIIKRKLEAG